MMKHFLLVILTLFILSAPAPTLEVEPTGKVDVEIRYVTDWTPIPMARIVWPEYLEVNAVRIRFLTGLGWGDWIHGHVAQVAGENPILRIPLKGLSPGKYKAMVDLRTPLGAVWKEIEITVPIVARFASEPIILDGIIPDWPHRRYPEFEQPYSTILLSWDMEYLYAVYRHPRMIRATTFILDLMPSRPGRHTYAFEFTTPTDELAIPWRALYPALPRLGQVLRVGQEDGPRLDVLFSGSGLPIHFGSTIVSHDPGGDDQGPPRPILEAIYDLIPGFNLREVSAEWGRVQSEDPKEEPNRYTWTDLYRYGNLYKNGLVIAHPGLWGDWTEKLRETDPLRHRKLSRDFLHAFVEECSRAGVDTYSCGWNEPELFHFSDREGRFIDDLNYTVEPIREANPDAKIIAGKFSGGCPMLVRSFIQAGFRDNFDILDIHNYNNDPRTGLDVGQIVACRQELVAQGMGHKRIYLGEGWGPTRDLHQKPRSRHDEPVSKEEADYHRQYFWNGYRSMVSPRKDYNPEWLLGAKYFTFNDNVGGTYWKHAARPVYNARGEIDYYLIGNLQFELEWMRSFFCNGGLVDFYGKPKGVWLFDFPPSLPQVRISARFPDPFLLRGRPAPIEVRVVNAERTPIEYLEIGLRPRTLLWKGVLSATAEETVTRERLNPGEEWKVNLFVTAEEGPAEPMRMAVELGFHFDGLYYTEDDVIPSEIREAVVVKFVPNRLTLDPRKVVGIATGRSPDGEDVFVRTEPVSTDHFSMTLTSNQKEELKGEPFQNIPNGMIVDCSPPVMLLSALAEKTFEVTVRNSGLSPGIHDLDGNWGTLDAIPVIVPLITHQLDTPPAIDGNLSDWPRQDPHTSVIRLGGKPSLGMGVPNVPFPVPTPVLESVIGTEPREAGAEEPDSPKLNPFGAQGVCGWDEQYLYLGFVVEDAKHVQNQGGADTWREDSIQIAIDPKDDGPQGQAATVARFRKHLDQEGYGTDDFELTAALTPFGPQLARVWAPQGISRDLLPNARIAVVHTGTHTVYEMAIPWNEIGIRNPVKGFQFRMDVLANNLDKEHRVTLGWGDGIARGKYPSRFTPVILQ